MLYYYLTILFGFPINFCFSNFISPVLRHAVRAAGDFRCTTASVKATLLKQQLQQQQQRKQQLQQQQQQQQQRQQ